MQNNFRAARSVVLAVAGLVVSLGAQADSGTSLLSPGYKTQLETWLGEGRLSLTNIYTKAAGDTSLDFHKASDGKGRTFSIMEATNASGQTWLVGGYNPQSWNSSGSYNMTPENSQRTAFIFNLSSGVIRSQTPRGYAIDTVGAYQTYNGSEYGPVFGYGHDLFVSGNLSTGGYSNMYSYIDPIKGGFGESLLDGSQYSKPNVTYGAMQIFTISVVPEPATYALLLAGLGLLAAVSLYKRPAILA